MSILHRGVTPGGACDIARLRYVSDQDGGFARRRNGGGFVYLDHVAGVGCATRPRSRGSKQLAIPPAWRDVWICRFANGHLQATGRDSRKRKQYVYHARWREIVEPREVLAAASSLDDALPALRQAVARDLRGGSAHARARAGRRRGTARRHVDPRRQRRVRAAEQFLRPHDAARPARDGRPRSLELRFVGKGGFRKEVVDRRSRSSCG